MDNPLRWRTLKEEKVPDLAAWVAEASGQGQVIHVGTDSLQTGRFTQFVTVVVVYTQSKGGRAAYTREVVRRITNLRERLLKETYKSIEVASLLNDLPNEMVLHVDANPDEKHMSSKYVQELVGLVMGMGFKSLIKPDAWAASHAADHVVRHLGKMPRINA